MDALSVIGISMSSQRCATDEETEENDSYEARVNDQPLRQEASEAWKRGWHEANQEWSGREIDF